MLDQKTSKKIVEFVHASPRSIDEIAKHIGKNWRTTDRYVQRIKEETGQLDIRIFREGTRGALKVVYFKNIAKISSTQFQENLLQQIKAGREKTDFSPFEVYQYVDNDKSRAYFMGHNDPDAKFLRDLGSSEKQVLFFSGNMSWFNYKEGRQTVEKIVEKITPKTSIKVITRVDFAGYETIERVLKINLRNKKESIEIRHHYQPLRGYIIDSKLARFWETKDPLKYKRGELPAKVKLVYEIYDPEWIDWLQKLFWNMFSAAIPAQKRIEDIKTIQQLKIKR